MIAIRYYEIADRFKGDDLSLQAQDRSLKEMMLGQNRPDGKKIAAGAPAIGNTEEPLAKAPVPTIAQLKEAEKTIRDIFKDDFAKTAVSDKAALAVKFERQADESKGDPAGQYELLLLAANLAAQSSDLELFMKICDSIARNFTTDAKDIRKVGLGTLIVVAKDVAVSKAAAAFKTLIDKPDDPVANLNAGKYAGLIKGNWEAAIPMLAKGPKSALKTLAEQELAVKEKAVSQMAVADAWYDASEKAAADKVEMKAYQERAAKWYATALPGLSGLSKIKAEKRIGAVGGLTPTAPAAADKTKTPNSPSAPSVKAPVTPSNGGTLNGETLAESKTFGPGIFKVAGVFKNHDKANVTFQFMPGTMISNGEFFAGNGGKIRVEGTDEKPVIFRNVTFTQDWGGYMFAKAAVFENCKFVKGGGWLGYMASKWRFNGCVFSHCSCPSLSGDNYGFNFQSCALIAMTIPEIKHNAPDDYDKFFRGDWNQIGGCTFVNCQIHPTVLLCSEVCNYINCKFVPGIAVTTKKDWNVELFPLNCTGTPEINAGDKIVKLLPVRHP